MNEIAVNSEVSTVDLPLAAYAVSKFQAVLAKTDVYQGKVRFFLQLKPGTTFSQISADYNSDGTVTGRLYSQEIRRLKNLVRSALNEFDQVLERAK